MQVSELEGILKRQGEEGYRTSIQEEVFAEEVVLGNRVLSRRWSDQSAQRVKVSTAILEVKQSESNL